MLNFPVPYDAETIYSVIARAGVNLAVLSPKQLLDDVFQDRKVVATMDLPCNLNKIAFHLQATGKFSALELIYQHTLFPLYAVFVPEYTRLKAIELMCESSGGTVHMMLGIAASNVKTDGYFRYCKSCVQSQYEHYGVAHWKREWFLPALKFCSEHGELSVMTSSFKEHRHSYFSASDLIGLSVTKDSKRCEFGQKISSKAIELLQIPPITSPSTNQWTAFYKKLASDLSYTKGKNVCHSSIYERFIASLSEASLKEWGLYEGLDSETGWLKTMFRKHRKSFSYLQHLLIWHVFLPELEVKEIIRQVCNMPLNKTKHRPVVEKNLEPSGECLEKRCEWEMIVKKLGVKGARSSNGGGALYAWLYRNDRIYFLAFNAKYKKKENGARVQKVNWKERDIKQTKRLFRLLNDSEANFPKQRMSSNWFLKQLGRDSMIYAYRDKMPLTWQFLNTFSENVVEYQLRRVAKYCAEQERKGNDIKPWKLYREAGLSDQRIRTETRAVLSGLGYIDA